MDFMYFNLNAYIYTALCLPKNSEVKIFPYLKIYSPTGKPVSYFEHYSYPEYKLNLELKFKLHKEFLKEIIPKNVKDYKEPQKCGASQKYLRDFIKPTVEDILFSISLLTGIPIRLYIKDVEPIKNLSRNEDAEYKIIDVQEKYNHNEFNLIMPESSSWHSIDIGNISMNDICAILLKIKELKFKRKFKKCITLFKTALSLELSWPNEAFLNFYKIIELFARMDNYKKKYINTTSFFKRIYIKISRNRIKPSELIVFIAEYNGLFDKFENNRFVNKNNISYLPTIRNKLIAHPEIVENIHPIALYISKIFSNLLILKEISLINEIELGCAHIPLPQGMELDLNNIVRISGVRDQE